jgi:hypothetical protein
MAQVVEELSRKLMRVPMRSSSTEVVAGIVSGYMREG